MSDVILDFETYRWEGDLFQEMLKDALAAVKAPGNYKKEEAISKYLAQEKPKVEKEFREKAALDPLTGRLLAASMAVEQFDPVDPDATKTLEGRWAFHYFLARDEAAEATLIGRVDEMLAAVKPRRIITFSGRNFDIPFYTGRAIIKGVALRYKMPSYRYDQMHFDMRDVLPKGMLDYWFRAVLGQQKEGSGKQVNEWVDEGDWDSLEKYCEDIKLAAALWERMRNVVRVK